ncbi:MAG TPA: hypothetical protein VFW89_00130 [Gemmatimonadaceae bacterium]|nr:hypothetical protein [Gemmatimonadaceae bacterium]
MPLNAPTPLSTPASPIAGSVLPIKRAEELLATLPGVVAARIVAADNGAVNEIHLLTTSEVNPKQTVRNVESALIAHLGMKVDHRKISVATTVEPPKTAEAREQSEAAATEAMEAALRRRLYFEDLEIRRSRTRGVTCRVTLRKGNQSYIGECDGSEGERSRAEVAARAAIVAMDQAHREAEGEGVAERVARALSLEGCRLIEAFEREFAFVGIMARQGRDVAVLTGSCEVKESAETAAVLAVLDATNRWLGRGK